MRRLTSSHHLEVLLPCVNADVHDPQCCKSPVEHSFGLIGGVGATVWASNAHDMYIMEHELGHNLGLLHAAEYNDHGHAETKDGSLGAKDAVWIDYGDTHDRMGQESVFSNQER